MICVGIDVAKDKHDCVILNSEGKVLAGVFTIPNNADGFDTLLQKIHGCTSPDDKIKVGLEATGHYSYNILGFLLNQGLPTYVINPLHTNLFRKSMSLRKTKTDRVDAKTIAAMLMSNVDLKSYTDTAYHNEELKSLTRYRFVKVSERAQLKQSVSRLVTILFPELEKLVPTLHMSSIYALLIEFPGAKQITEAHLTHLKSLLKDASKGRYGRDMATEIRDAAKHSIGSVMPAKSLELRHTIRLIRELDSAIEDIESAIEAIMDEIQSPITTIPGMGFRMGARSLPMQVCHRLLINQGSFHWLEPTLTWRNEALATCAMRFTTRPSMFVIGTQALRLTLLKSELRESITTLHFLMPLRNWFG